MAKMLKKDFFDQATLKSTKSLLGKNLVRKIGNQTIVLPINEVEAYIGPQDKASHASRGLTPRNAPMFGKPGYFYVYLVYGMHHMLNIVTEKEGYPAAILIRGAGNISGPGKLTKFLKIDKKFNKLPCTKKTGLWIEDGGIILNAKNIKQLPRVGVDYAGQVWSQKPYRFILKDNY